MVNQFIAKGMPKIPDFFKGLSKAAAKTQLPAGMSLDKLGEGFRGLSRVAENFEMVAARKQKQHSQGLFEQEEGATRSDTDEDDEEDDEEEEEEEEEAPDHVKKMNKDVLTIFMAGPAMGNITIAGPFILLLLSPESTDHQKIRYATETDFRRMLEAERNLHVMPAIEYLPEMNKPDRELLALPEGGMHERNVAMLKELAKHIQYGGKPGQGDPNGEEGESNGTGAKSSHNGTRGSCACYGEEEGDQEGSCSCYGTGEGKEMADK
eukprot:g8607.t1